MKLIKFEGQEYVFGGDSLNESGFIATKEQFENYQCPFAHYFPGRGVMQHGERIGGWRDIKILGNYEDDVPITPERIANLVGPWA